MKKKEIMKLTEVLDESFLYHGTGALNAAEILLTNRLAGGHRKINGKFYPTCSSLSRSFRSSRIFAETRTYIPMVFEFDAKKLAHNHKILPFSFSNMPKLSFTDTSFANQREEVIIGPVENLDRFITKLIFFKKDFNDLKELGIKELLEYPKLYLWDSKAFVNLPLHENEKLHLPDLEVGDELLVGKFKNKKATITGFTKDDYNQPVAKTNKGDQKIFKGRLAKLIKDKN